MEQVQILLLSHSKTWFVLEIIIVPLICKVERFVLAKLALPVIGTEMFGWSGLIQNWGLVA